MSTPAEDLHLGEIDALNLSCYDHIASEYDDPEHETCRDFDTGTHCFLQKAIKTNLFIKGFKYLDVGVGTGKSLECIMPWLQQMQAKISVLDISPRMIEATKAKFGDTIEKYHTVSIHDFKTEEKYDLIVAALCDPYLTKKSIEIYKGLLNEEGVLMMTLPTNTWATKVRSENTNKTTFHDREGNEHMSFSFCWSKGDLIKFVESVGLMTHQVRVVFVQEVVKLKQNISKLNQRLSYGEKRVPMLLTLIFLNK